MTRPNSQEVEVEVEEGFFIDGEVKFTTKFKGQADRMISTEYAGKPEGDTIKEQSNRLARVIRPWRNGSRLATKKTSSGRGGTMCDVRPLDHSTWRSRLLICNACGTLQTGCRCLRKG